tara:strand:+ start:137 stop:376 length:240 start_codon:yes stop_codon:yes gene_type:complete
MAKKKEQTKQEPMDMVLDLIDALNDSVKNIHDRIDLVQKQVTKVSEATKLGSDLHKGQGDLNAEFVKMVHRMADRMGIK